MDLRYLKLALNAFCFTNFLKALISFLFYKFQKCGFQTLQKYFVHQSTNLLFVVLFSVLWGIETEENCHSVSKCIHKTQVCIEIALRINMVVQHLYLQGKEIWIGNYIPTIVKQTRYRMTKLPLAKNILHTNYFNI